MQINDNGIYIYMSNSLLWQNSFLPLMTCQTINNFTNSCAIKERPVLSLPQNALLLSIIMLYIRAAVSIPILVDSVELLEEINCLVKYSKTLFSTVLSTRPYRNASHFHTWLF